MILYVSAENQSNERVFESTRIYMPQSTDSRNSIMVFPTDKKLGIIRDTSIQPFTPKEETFEIPISKDVKNLKLTVQLSYSLRPGEDYPVHSVIKNVTFR
jgi:hypothetical protein